MATLEITAQGQFGHTEDLLGHQIIKNDPRRDDFDWDLVRIDLSRCEFFRPAGVLWCTIYPLLVTERGIPCELVVPDQPLTATYLNDLGLFSTLKDAGVHVGYDASPNLDRWQLVVADHAIRLDFRCRRIRKYCGRELGESQSQFGQCPYRRLSGVRGTCEQRR